jgi:hypothetical protein
MLRGSYPNRASEICLIVRRRWLNITNRFREGKRGLPVAVPDGPVHCQLFSMYNHPI